MLILALIGGILGIVIGIFSVILGGVSTVIGNSSYLMAGGAIDIFFSILAIVAGVIAKKRRRLASILLIVSGVLGSIFVTVYPIAGVLLVIAGLIGLIKKERNSKNVPA